MYLKIFRETADLATPAVSLEDLTAKLPIAFRIQSQAWPFGSNCSQGATWMLSRSCSLCGF
jgi:hypothetical protein